MFGINLGVEMKDNGNENENEKLKGNQNEKIAFGLM